MQLSDVVIGLEATSIYGDSLVYALREDGSLGRFQRKIHVLTPKQVRKFKEAYPDLPKNDWVDAFVIADHLRFGRIAKEIYMDDYRYQALRTLTRARFDMIQNLTREKQRFANHLFLKYSGIAQNKDIQNTSATTIALMEHFETVDDLANADLNELTAFISEAGRGRFADPVSKPCFKKCQEQGLVWCCLFAAYIVRSHCFSSKFFCITYLTSYNWTCIDCGG